ncbi:MAG TPA: BlaI/MecI/CopY family transcriptional regulator [Terriglobia bacterium]|nr:BlaI/MecI/CopY family transcriptional regulator [Terriglobia bacterium]
MNSTSKRKSLSPLEQVFMDYVWAHPSCTAEMCRVAMASQRAFKESTIRTVLKNLEKKGYVKHEVRGRTFFYQAVDTKRNVTIEAARQLIERFCGGSVKELLVGLVDNQVIKPNELRKLAEEIAARKEKKS